MLVDLRSEIGYLLLMITTMGLFFAEILVGWSSIILAICATATGQPMSSKINVVNVLLIDVIWISGCVFSERFMNLVRRIIAYPWGSIFVPFLITWETYLETRPETKKVLLYCSLSGFTSITEYFSTQMEELKREKGKKSEEYIFAKNCHRVFLRQMPNKISKVNLTVRTSDMDYLSFNHLRVYWHHFNRVAPLKENFFYRMTEFLVFFAIAGCTIDEWWVDGEMVGFATSFIFGESLIPGTFCCLESHRKLGFWFWGYRLALKRAIADPKVKFMMLGNSSTGEEAASTLMAKRKTMCKLMKMENDEEVLFASKVMGFPGTTITMGNLGAWFRYWGKGFSPVEEKFYTVHDESDVVG